MSSTRRIVLYVATAAVLATLGAGAAYLMTGSTVALRVLWLTGPIALTSVCFVVLQLWLPKDGS
jgi:glucose-6-phosphate-specific signal transduction histidine kinase